MEDFGSDLDDFGSEPEAVAPEQSIEELQAMVEDLNKQIAATMDELEQQRLRNAKKVILDQINGAVAPSATSKTEGQWTDLAKAYKEFFGDGNPWAERLASLGGVCDAAYEGLRHELAEANRVKEAATAKPKGGRGKGGKKAAEPAIPVNERFAALVQHGKNLGIDTQMVYDELGLTELDDVSLDALLAAINERANAAPVVPVSGGDDGATDGDAAEPARETFFSDSAFAGLVNPVTGEVIERSWLLDKLGWLDFPTEPSRECAAAIVDLQNTLYLGPAARYRSNAENLAAPLEKRAKDLDAFFGPYLDACGEKFLGKHKSDSRVDAKSQHKAGDFKEKTLKFVTGSISWSKEGGPCVTDPPKFHAWLAEKRGELLVLKEKNTPEALEEMKALEAKYGLKLVTEVAYDKEKCAKELPPGWSDLPVNELASRKIN